MLHLNYYYIDVGENSCTILKRKSSISFENALWEKNKVELILIKEFLVHWFKKKTIFFSLKDFKIVFVNKQNKIKIKTEVKDERTDEIIKPITVTKNHIVYIVQPSQALDIECQVVPKEIENRHIPYDSIHHTW